MPNGYSPKEIAIEPGFAVGASETDLPVSRDSGLSAGGATNGLRVVMSVSSVTVVNAISAELQHRTIDTWTTLSGASASVTISGDGEFVLKQLSTLSADEANFPLNKQLRVVVTTGVGDSVTFDNIKLLQEL